MDILQAKLRPPPLRGDHVRRPRLVQLLEQGREARLTLLSAPAGFGKTSLLSEWLARSERPFAWITLDEDDNAWPRFLTAVLGSLQRIDPALATGLLGALGSAQPPPIEHFLSALPRALAAVARPFVLVLEDFHVLSNPQIHDLLTFLIDNQPPPMQLVLAGRSDPPWPLARLRASGALVEIRSADLRFTLNETQALLNETLDLQLSHADLAALDERTEGWVTGLRLAAISLKDTPDRPAFLRAFTGSDRFVLDYLIEEVLARQSPEVNDFLRQTSLLDCFNASLCDHATGRRDSQAMLRHLETANLFVDPLDHERLWFTYHALMRSFLRSIQHQQDPAETSAIHLRASAWYEANGDVLDAIQHALAAGAREQVDRLIRSNVLALVFQGELGTVLGWLHGSHATRTRAGPWLRVAHLWAHSFSGDDRSVGDEVIEAQALVVEEIRALEDGAEASRAAELRHALAHLTAIQAHLAVMDGRHAEAAQLARQALSGLPAADSTTRRYSYVILGMSLRHLGELAAAAESLSLADAPGSDVEQIPAPARGLATRAGIQIWMGRLDEAEATCRRLIALHDEHLRRCGRRLPIAAFGYARLSDVLLQRNDVAQALSFAQESHLLAEQWHQTDALFESDTHLARALHAGGDTASALARLHNLANLLRDRSPWLHTMIQMEQARLCLSAAKDSSCVERAHDWASAHPLPEDRRYIFRDHALYLTHAQLLLSTAPSNAQSALAGLTVVQALLELFEAAGAQGLLLQASILHVLFDSALGRTEAALVRLRTCLHQAESQGYVRFFLDQGAPMTALLARVPASDPTHAYARRLLAASAAPGPVVAAPGRAMPGEEPLSERELEVLRLLTTTLSSAEIADQLCVATSTVRSHTKAIYGKLGVHTRLEAIDEGRDRGLIASP